MKLGVDNKGKELYVGDICKFKINGKNHEGMISYDDSSFAFTFQMLDNNFPEVYMSKADLFSIEKIISIWSTNIKEKQYEGYRKFYTLKPIIRKESDNERKF